MRTSQIADLEHALRAFLVSVDGDGPGASDKAPTSPFAQAREQAGAAFGSPGARAAAAANAGKAQGTPSPNTGQTSMRRRASLPEPVQQAAAEADRLLASLQRISSGDLGHPTPGRDAAMRQGGTRASLASDLQRNYWNVGA